MMENGRIKAWLPAVRSGSGSEVFTLRLATALEKNGIATHITWYTKWDELIPLRMILAVPPPKVDVIITNSWTSYAVNGNKQPIITIVHHAIFDPALNIYKNFWQKLYHKFFAEPRERRSLTTADAIITVSDYVARNIRSRYGIANVKVLPNWIDTEKFLPAPSYTKMSRPFRLLFIGRPTTLKGAKMLSPIMKSLGPDFELWISATRKECDQLALPGNTTYLGRLDEPELIAAYQQSDALLCPSYSEGFGYVALEAMACGKPVIASNTGGLKELITDNVNGILCRPNCINDFVEACRHISTNFDDYVSMGKASRSIAVEKYSNELSYVELVFKEQVQLGGSRRPRSR